MDGISEGRGVRRSRLQEFMKLNPAVEEEEGSVQVEYVEEVVLDLDEETTLVDGEAGVMQGIKEMEVEITDDESEQEEDEGANTIGCGIKRKRTIRLIIRSRAFL